MPFHIGKLIIRRLESIGMTKSEFARRIKTSPQYAHHLLQQKSLDTVLLQKISVALGYDFFQHFMSLRKINKRENKLFEQTPTELHQNLKQSRSELKIIQNQNMYLKEIIALNEQVFDKNVLTEIRTKATKKITLKKSNQNKSTKMM